MEMNALAETLLIEPLGRASAILRAERGTDAHRHPPILPDTLALAPNYVYNKHDKQKEHVIRRNPVIYSCNCIPEKRKLCAGIEKARRLPRMKRTEWI